MITCPRIITPGNITVYPKGRPPLTLPKDGPVGQRILSLLLDRDATDDDLNALLSGSHPLVEYISADQEFKILTNGTVTYRGETLPGSLADRIVECWKGNVPFQFLMNFFSRLWANPSMRARKELYKFLEHENLPITERGTFLAYKGVNPDGWSCTGNKSTTVLRGQVDANGRILNSIGATIEVVRRCVNDDCNVGCAEGIHVGSREYAQGFGPRHLLVEVDPADVVSVPLDCSFQKVRVCKYMVIGEDTAPMVGTAVHSENPNDRTYESNEDPIDDDDDNDDSIDVALDKLDDVAEDLSDAASSLAGALADLRDSL